MEVAIVLERFIAWLSPAWANAREEARRQILAIERRDTTPRLKPEHVARQKALLRARAKAQVRWLNAHLKRRSR